MAVAVEMYFNEYGERQIRTLMAVLTERGIPPILDQLGFRPHISLAVFPDLEIGPIASAVREFTASTIRFPVGFSHIGIFPTTEGVVFLAPNYSELLRRTHLAFHTKLSQAHLASSPYYEPDRWVPHCTMTSGLEPPQMALAVQTLVEVFRPCEVQCASLGVINFPPLKTHARFELGGT